MTYDLKRGLLEEFAASVGIDIHFDEIIGVEYKEDYEKQVLSKLLGHFMEDGLSMTMTYDGYGGFAPSFEFNENIASYLAKFQMPRGQDTSTEYVEYMQKMSDIEDAIKKIEMSFILQDYVTWGENKIFTIEEVEGICETLENILGGLSDSKSMGVHMFITKVLKAEGFEESVDEFEKKVKAAYNFYYGLLNGLYYLEYENDNNESGDNILDRYADEDEVRVYYEHVKRVFERAKDEGNNELAGSLIFVDEVLKNAVLYSVPMTTDQFDWVLESVAKASKGKPVYAYVAQEWRSTSPVDDLYDGSGSVFANGVDQALKNMYPDDPLNPNNQPRELPGYGEKSHEEEPPLNGSETVSIGPDGKPIISKPAGLP